MAPIRDVHSGIAARKIISCPEVQFFQVIPVARYEVRDKGKAGLVRQIDHPRPGCRRSGRCDRVLGPGVLRLVGRSHSRPRVNGKHAAECSGLAAATKRAAGGGLTVMDGDVSADSSIAQHHLIELWIEGEEVANIPARKQSNIGTPAWPGKNG